MTFSKLMTVPAFLLMTTAISAHAGGDNGHWNTNAKGVVLDGYDVVAYFTQASAVKGAKRYATSHDGATFYFSSAANRDAFKKEPGKYVPAFGGYCAFAVAAKNAKVKSDPKTFKIYNGQLLVFFNDLWDGKKFNTKVPWNQNEIAMHQKADTNWKSLK